MESEDAYIDFIKINQRVELNRVELNSVKNVEKCLKAMRTVQQSDRLVFDKANRAFVSYIQAYQKHECSLILRLKDLDLGKVAMGFGLLKMPKMPELKNQETSSFQETEIDLNSIAYKDKQRETKRIEKLKEYRQTGVWPGKHKRHAKQTEPWSEAKKNKSDKRDKRVKRKEKKALAGPAKKKRKKVCQEDIDELAKDIALIKKLKKKKVVISVSLYHRLCRFAEKSNFSILFSLADISRTIRHGIRDQLGMKIVAFIQNNTTLSNFKKCEHF